MTRRKKIILGAALLLLVLAVAIGFVAVPHEPSHQGRPLSAWVKDFENTKPETRKAAEDAIRAMGPKALPFLTQSLEQRNSAALRFYRGNPLARKWLGGLRQKMKWHEPVMESRNAATALSVLGPEADQAIPNLVAALSDYSPLVAQEAAKALGTMGPRAVPSLLERLRAAPTNDTVWVVRAFTAIGPAGKEAAPELARLAQLSNPIADYSVMALARIGAPAVPYMTNMLMHTNVSMRVRASSFFWQAGASSILATNILLQAANDPDPTVRNQVWNALAASHAPVEITRPVWLRGLRDPNTANAQLALFHLSGDPVGVYVYSNELAEIFLNHPQVIIRAAASNILTVFGAWPKK